MILIDYRANIYFFKKNTQNKGKKYSKNSIISSPIYDPTLYLTYLRLSKLYLSAQYYKRNPKLVYIKEKGNIGT